jgi:TRAP-type mannitol/chloroaromatic compound transport system permease small subunit
VNALLGLSRLVDKINETVGRLVYWLVLAAVIISAGNATVRYALNMSSNAWLEVQWYLFAAIFLLCAGYTLLRNEHIRIDIISGHLSKRGQAWIDLFGTVFFLLPMAIMIMVLSWPLFWNSYLQNEVSMNAGGLLRWPVKILVPIGFLLLVAQGFSELIKRIAFLAGYIDQPGEEVHGHGTELEAAIAAAGGRVEK